jgi:8-oxo-dGTP diphosphatase
MIEVNKNIKVGTGVMIFKDGKILVGKRRNRHGHGEYSFPGGHLDYMESLEDCVKKEYLEEVGVKIKNIKFLCVSNETAYPPRHGILIAFTADWKSGTPRDLPEERIGEWKWCDINKLPKPIFLPAKVMVQAYKSKRNYYDKK